MKTKSDYTYVGGKGIWTEYKNNKTGESTIRSLGKLSEKPDLLDPNCTHFWELTNPHSNSVQCQKCGRGRTIVWGMEFVKNGQIIKNSSL